MGAEHGSTHREGRTRAAAAFSARSVGGFTPALLAAIDDDSIF